MTNVSTTDRKARTPAKKRGARRIAGGAATASGMNFQAVVTAIAGVHLLVGAPLGWLDGLAVDTPLAVWAESSGPGDDIRIELKNNERVEVQVKKGLSRGDDLWGALLALANGLHARTITYGVLVVSPDSSKTISFNLSQDIRRLGEGRSDGLSEIGNVWRARLEAEALPIVAICARLRICVVHGIDADFASITLAKVHLTGLCAVHADADRAWTRLYQDAHTIAARRGRWEATALSWTLASLGVLTKSSATPGSVVSRLSRWVYDANQGFSLVGVKASLSISDAWLPLKARVCEATEEMPADLAEAMARYHASSSGDRSGRRDEKTVDAAWIGRFHTRAVIVAGPGMGKSTLITKLAHLYARDGYPVLKVRLSAIAARLASGHGFHESVLHLGLDGSDVSAKQAAESGLSDWVLLCDGLDECGSQQNFVAAGITQFATGNPRARVIVTTRPIGYHTTHLSDWRHYELLAPKTSAGSANLASLLLAASATPSAHTDDSASSLATEQLQRSAAREVVSRSPQLLGMAASLLARGGALGSTKVELYQNLFEIIDLEPHVRSGIPGQPNVAILTRVLNILGWELVAEPLAPWSTVMSRCTARLHLDLGGPPLQAQTAVNAAMDYWQEVGLIEKVHHGPSVMITFVHKTFAEFAAARCLWDATDPTERSTLLSICLEDHERWSEVLAFASSRMGEEILQALVARHALDDRRATERALRLLADAPTGVSETTGGTIIRLAFDVVDSGNTFLAWRIGPLLADLAATFPKAIDAMATDRLSAPQSWTQRIAWACVAGTGSFDLDAAHTKLREFLADARPIRTSLLGGLVIERNPEDSLHERIALAIIKRAVREWPADRIDSLLAAFNDQAFDTVGFQGQLSDIAKAAGVTLRQRRDSEGKSRLASILPSSEYKEAHVTAMRALLDGVASAATVLGNGAAFDPPLQLSALFDVIGLNESPASDVWVWTEPYDPEPVREVLRGLIALSVVDPGQLQLEVVAACARLEEEGRDGSTWFSPDTIQVDVPALDWNRSASLGLDRHKLKQATLHGSQWLAVAATNLLEHLDPLSSDELAAQLSKANGLGLATSSYLARKQGPDGMALLLDRLAGPVVSGFEHLLNALGKSDLPWSSQLSTGLCKALHAGDARVAQAAANLALKYLQFGAKVPREMLEDAYEFWMANEAQYPKESGLVPESPRKTLLSAKSLIDPIPDEHLIELLDDSRSDVKDFALEVLIVRATESEQTRELAVSAMTSKQVSAASVGKLLASTIPFGTDVIERLCRLLGDDDAAYRLAALQLLKSVRMPTTRVRELAQRMAKDPHHEVRRSALILTSKLEAD